jgi:hypothetical protein
MFTVHARNTSAFEQLDRVTGQGCFSIYVSSRRAGAGRQINLARSLRRWPWMLYRRRWRSIIGGSSNRRNSHLPPLGLPALSEL